MSSQAFPRLLGRPVRLALIGVLALCCVAMMICTGQSPVTKAAVTQAPSAPAPAPAVVAPAPAPAPAPVQTSTVHLRRGDTLWALARQYGTTVAALAELNHLGASTRIIAGTDLRVTGKPAVSGKPARKAAARPAAHVTAVRNAVQQTAATVFGSQYRCAADIIARESGWDVQATNRGTGAYGLAQALPATKMASAGPDWRGNPLTQLRWMRDYVGSRYGDACRAWDFWRTHSWY